MERMDMVETLRNKAQVGYEEARDALERTDWDLLEAVVLLEKEGKVEQVHAAPKSEHTEQGGQSAPHNQNAQKATEALENAGEFVGNLVNKGNRKHLELTKEGRTTLSIPLTVLALVLLLFFWLAVPAAVIAWLVGYRFRLVDKPVKEPKAEPSAQV